MAAPSPAGDGGRECRPRPPCEVADVVRRYGERFAAGHRPSGPQRRVLWAIAHCRTAALGGHVERCEDCAQTRITYNSCRNRHCPKCQSGQRAAWFAAQQALLLPVPYFHVVFTLPHSLNAVIRLNRHALYGLLFRAAITTLQQFAANPKHLGAELGITAVLHTWGQTLTEHVHLHCVVTGGGLSPDGRRWVGVRKRRQRRLFLFPVRALSAVFRAKCRDGLQALRAHGQLRLLGPCAPLHDRVHWARFLHTLTAAPWVVYAKPPFGGPAVVLKYLSRYTHRIAIANQRLLSLDQRVVRFQYRDYADHNAAKVMSLTAEEFLRRFLLHVLPAGFKRIRHFGLLATRNRTHKLQRCRDLLGRHPPHNPAPASAAPLATGETEDTRHERRCPNCGSLRVHTIEILPALRPSRAPP